MPLRSKKIKGLSEISDDSLLRTQNDISIPEEQPKTPPATFISRSEVGNEVGSYWYMDAYGSRNVNQSQGTNGTPPGGTMRTVEYRVNDWQVR